MQKFRTLAAGFAFLLALLALPAAALADPAITITPATGDAGTTFEVVGRGFEPNSSPILFVEDATGNNAAYRQPRVGADGGFRVTLNSSDYEAGEYRVVVAAILDLKPLAQGIMTVNRSVTAMPRTGAGGAASGAPAPWPVLAGLGAVALLGLAAGIGRRRAL